MLTFQTTRKALLAGIGLFLIGAVVLAFVAAHSLRDHRASQTPVWIVELKDEDPDVRRMAAVMLGEYATKTPEALDALIDAMEDDDYFVRAAVVFAIGRFGPQARDAVPLLLRALANGVGDVPACAAFALGRIGDKRPEVITALTQASQVPDPHLSGRAREALRELAAQRASAE